MWEEEGGGLGRKKGKRDVWREQERRVPHLIYHPRDQREGASGEPSHIPIAELISSAHTAAIIIRQGHPS